MRIKMSEREIKAACAEWLDTQLTNIKAISADAIVLESNARNEIMLVVEVEVEE